MVNSSLSPYQQGSELWKSFQTKVQDYINGNGGKASRQPETIRQPDWKLVKDVLDGRKPLSTLNSNCQ